MHYDKEHTKELIFPLGGIGTGSVGFAGNGMLKDWEIFNRPAKGSLNGYSHLALRADTKDGPKMKVLNGDLTKDLIGQYGSHYIFDGYGYGPKNRTMAGFDHFREWSFDGEFPLAALNLSDPDFPVKVRVEAYNPMIPNDTENSSIPGAFFEIIAENTGDEDLDLTAAFVLQNPFETGRNTILPKGNGIFLKNTGVPETDTGYGDLTLSAEGGDIFLQEYWYRGGWQDGLSTYNNEFGKGEGLRARHYDTDGSYDHCTVAVKNHCPKGETTRFFFLLTWNIPNNYNYWNPLKDAAGKDVTWKNWYATRWENSAASSEYALRNRDALKARTVKFHDALWNSTLDPYMLDAAASTLSVLHTPTVLRLEDGSFYGWEGCREVDGSCEGSCTHVWNYAYALCYLFPALERSIRRLDFKYNLLENGAMRFRLPLPLGREGGWNMPCVDGQMGGIIKLYRDWKLSGDDAFLKELWPMAKRSLEFAWSEENPLRWDQNKDGVLEGRQHHTLDMELYGPSSWLQGMYLLALKCGAEISEYLGDKDAAAEYLSLYEKGSSYMEKYLFNGKWYIEDIDLSDKSLLLPYESGVTTLNSTDLLETYWNDEVSEIKYQIGEGCEIDQCLAEWHAELIGAGSVYDPEHLKSALSSIYEYNHKDSFRGFTNPWRLFYLNDEGGTIMCAYPEGTRKPAIPVPYCEETMHGFEYAAAGLMFRKGFTKEARSVVKSVRERYNGANRNPYNEIECGNNYARSMASFALLMISSGFTADLPHKLMTFDPLPCVMEDVKSGNAFSSLWSLEGGYGTIRISASATWLRVLEGILPAKSLCLPYLTQVTRVEKDGCSVPFTFKDGILTPGGERDFTEMVIS